jgi:5-methylcytosine-specific restriction endonuclease McrA
VASDANGIASIASAPRVPATTVLAEVLLDVLLIMARLLRNWSGRDWKRWYSCQRWKDRRDHQLRTEPMCAKCLETGLVVPAVIADHLQHHAEDWNRFWLSPLQSLCRDCHERKHGRKQDVQIGLDGWPVEPG